MEGGVMGIIGRLLTKGPGGPVSIAKTMLKSYNICRAINPGISDTEAFRQVVLSRYVAIKKLSPIEIDVISLSVESIGDIITIIIYIEVPVAFGRDMLDDTFCELEKFYIRNAPDELESLTRVPNMIRIAKDMKCTIKKPC
jgi:hypothetical protein